MTGTDMEDEINRTALRRLMDVMGGDPADLEEILSDFEEDGPALSRQITDAAASSDAGALRIAAHSLKSNARDLGATHLADLCAELEDMAAADQTEGASAMAARIAEAEAAARLALSRIEVASLTGREQN